MTQTAPEYRKLKPRKLAPPPDHAKKMFNLDRNKLPKNKFLRFWKIFFSDGF